MSASALLQWIHSDKIPDEKITWNSELHNRFLEKSNSLFANAVIQQNRVDSIGEKKVEIPESSYWW